MTGAAAGSASSLRIRGATIVGREADGPLDIDVEGGAIAAIGPAGGGPTAASRNVDIDAGGLLAAPGFVELQINGGFGHDFTADPASIWTVGAGLPRHGVTAFLPTIVSSPRDVVEAGRRTLLAGPPPGYGGAAALGLHVEGPFIAAERIGAHDPAHRRDPDPAFVEGWSPATGIRLVTLAPELPGALELIAVLAARGIVVSIGHTAATAAEAQAGFDAGARFVTHLFNAMPGLDHREPGPVGAALADPRVTVGLIPDGLHVDPLVVDVAWRRAGPGRLAVVTDAIAALGMSPGSYHLGTMDVVVDASSARLADGRLAGSLLTLDRAVRNLRAFTGASVADVIGAVTSTPARLLGLAATHGELRPGVAADVVLLTPELEVAATVIRGRVAHRAEAVA
jgi:N-acetylglucosamine-6-phosphate deacetylase